MRVRDAESDRSQRYETDALVRLIEDTIKKEPAQRRLYPDLYSERLADAIRTDAAALLNLTRGES